MFSMSVTPARSSVIGFLLQVTVASLGSPETERVTEMFDPDNFCVSGYARILPVKDPEFEESEIVNRVNLAVMLPGPLMVVVVFADSAFANTILLEFDDQFEKRYGLCGIAEMLRAIPASYHP